MAKSSTSESNKAKTAVIVIIAVIVVLSFVLVMVNCIGKTSKLTATYNGKVIKTGQSFYLPYSGEAQIEFSGYEGELIIEVLPNVTSKTDFEYTVDGQSYKFSETNLTSVFIMEATESILTISCKPGQYGLANVLLNAQSGAELTSEIPRMDYPFKLVVVTTSGESLEFSFVQFSLRFEPEGGYIF